MGKGGFRERLVRGRGFSNRRGGVEEETCF